MIGENPHRKHSPILYTKNGTFRFMHIIKRSGV